MLRRVALIAFWLMTGTQVASAQEIPLWGHKIIGQIYAAQFNNGCYVKPLETPSVYLLGVIPSDKILNEEARVELVSRLSSILSAQGNIRFRSAGAFQPIAHSTGAGDETGRTELRKLVQSASNDDLTILLRPYAKRGDMVDLRVMLWARDGQSGSRKLTCTPEINVSYKVGTTDSTCSNAWKAARRINTLRRYQGFVDFLGHCPEADEAQRRIIDLKKQESEAASQASCRDGFNAAKKTDTSQAYEQYLEQHTDCPNADVVYARLKELRTRETKERKNQACATAYRNARSANTPAAFDAFLSANPNCPQQDAAIGLRDALIVHQNAQNALKNAQRRANQNTSRPTTNAGSSGGNVSCGNLWYQRNLIFHNNGYRFTTARGRRTFGTGGYTRNPRLSKSEKRRVNQIKRLERQYRC